MLKARYKGSIIKDTVIMLLDNKYKVMGIFVLLVLGIFFFLNAGKMSVDNEPPQQADVIMVPIGGFPDRIHYAVDLYKQGYADKIIMVESWEPVSDRLNARGVKITTLAQQTAMLAIQMGVPTSAVTILPGAALSFKEEGTEQEALYFLKYLQEHPENKKVILTTSLFHSARADAIFEWAVAKLPGKVNIVSCPTPYDSFQADKWWKSRGDIEDVVSEYTKWAYFDLVDQWTANLYGVTQVDVKSAVTFNKTI